MFLYQFVLKTIAQELFFEVCDGNISYKPMGLNGFGYDSIFIPRGYKKTFAQMSLLEKKK